MKVQHRNFDTFPHFMIHNLADSRTAMSSTFRTIFLKFVDIVLGIQLPLFTPGRYQNTTETRLFTNNIPCTKKKKNYVINQPQNPHSHLTIRKLYKPRLQ